eukprot:4085195-Pleurochrysis_carterae.AAC.1
MRVHPALPPCSSALLLAGVGSLTLRSFRSAHFCVERRCARSISCGHVFCANGQLHVLYTRWHQRAKNEQPVV